MEPLLRLGRVPDPLSNDNESDDIAGIFKTSRQAYREDVVPASRASVGSTTTPTSAPASGGFDLYGRLGSSSPAPAPSKESGGFDLYADVRKQTQPAPAQPTAGSFSRGLKSGGIDSAKETAVGAAALAADTVGAKDTATSLFGKYKSMRDQSEAESQGYESFSNVMDGKASFGSFLGYWGGYAIGQAAQTVAVAGAGALAGSAVGPAGTVAGAIGGVFERGAAQTGIKALVAKKLEGQIAEHMAASAAKGIAREEAEKLAYQAAAKSVFRELGAAVAVTGQNVAMEGASIYGEARSDAEKRGEETDLGRVWTGTILAAATESAMDLVGLKGMQKAFGGGNIFKNIAVESFKGGAREGVTEAMQTGFERYGAKQDLTSDEAKRDYIDSAAGGAVGGVLFGSAKGTMKTLRGEDDNVKRTIADARAAFEKKTETEQTTQEEKPTNSAGFVPEPTDQLQAQLNAVRDGRKQAVVMGQQEAGEVDSSGLHRFDIADPQTGDIAVVFGMDPKLGEQVQARANEVGLKPAMGEVLGYVEPNATTNPAPDSVVVQQVDDKSGQIIQEQAVSPENADKVAPIPGTTVQTTTAEQAQTDRVQQAADKAATSPNNTLAEPTEGQKSAGNYQKGHVRLQGLDIAIENPAGSNRSGTDPNGKSWSQTMANHYGYVKGSVGKDKDHVDVFIGPNPESKTVFVVDQKSQDGKFDEHKAMLGFDSEQEAADAYHANYEEGWQGMGAITAMPMDAFKSWVKDGTKRKPLAYDNKAEQVAPAAQQTEQTAKQQDKSTNEGEMASEQEAFARWEDDDDGKNHILWSDLPKNVKEDVRTAVAGGYYNTPMHDEIVERVRRNERTERSNAKAAENRKGKEEADGIDLKRARPARDFAYVQVKSITQLQQAAQRQLDMEGNGQTIELSAVPVGSLVNTMPGLGAIEKAAKLFGKKVKYFRVIDGPGFFDGAVIPGSDTIFINTNATYPHLHIFGHELVHAIKNAHPETYQRLKTFLMPMLDEAGMIDFALRQQKEGVTKQEAILEEAIGDIVGDRFGEQEFWKLMAAENPNLFRQMADIVNEFIEKVLAKLKGTDANLGSSTLVTDLNAVRTNIATVLKDLGDMVQEEQAAQAKPKTQTATTTQSEQTPTFKRVELQETKGFYSALQQAFVAPKISLDKNGATTGQQWKAWLNSKKSELNVKPDEIEWVGIDNWFDLNADQKLTKDQVLQWVAGNRVNVNEILLRSYGEVDASRGPVAEFAEPDEDTLREFVRDRIDEHESDLSEYDEDAFSVSPDDMNVAELRSWIAENFGWQNFMYDYRRSMESFQRGRVAKMTRPKHGGGSLVLKGGENYAELVLFDPTVASYAQGDDVHYGDITRGQAIGWLRMNERKDSAGNPVLFLEELQSKRGQDLRKGEDVPDAPFIKKTESWTALLIKRAVAYAQQRGIDRVVWTTGEQQNERYAFPGDELVYKKDSGKDTFTLTVNKGGELVRTVNDVAAKNLAAYVGEDAAKEIGNGEVSGVLRGDDLKVMEANLQPYYNQTVPSVAKKFLKEFGGMVEVMEIEGTGQQLGFVIPSELQDKVAEDGLPMFKRKAYEAQFDDLPQNVRDMAVAKGHYSPPTVKERLEALKPNMWRRVVQGTFDRFHSVKDISMKAYMMLRMSTTSDGAVEGLLHYGQVFDDGGALNIRKGTKGLLEILKPVGAETDRFLLWIAANRAALLKKEERENFFTQAEIDELKKLNLGTMKDGKYRAGVYAETLTKMNELNRSVLELAKDKGLIDEAGYKKFAADIWYIPFYRVMDGEKTLSAAQTSSAAVNQYLSKKLKGSTRQVNDLMENVLLNWSHILSASMKNSAAVETLSAAERMGGLVTRLTKVDEKFGVDAQNNKYPLKYAVKVMEKGKEIYYNIDDEFLLASLDGVVNVPTYGMWTTLGREFKTTLTRFISLSPTFKINNLIRDSVQALGTSELKLNPVANVIQGWRAYKDDRAEALVGGGLFAMGNAYDGDRASHVKRLIKMGVDDATILTTAEKAKAWFGKMGEKYDELSDKSENANRLALYHQLRSNGATHLEAAYAARDLQDFSLQGSFGAIRYAAMLLPYFNARLQGLYKLGRATEENPQRFAAVLTGITAVGLALYLGQKDDEDWKKREEWDKDAFFWFKVGNQAIRIPKPFEMGAAETIIERFVEQLVDKDVEGKVFGKRLLAVLHDQLAINPIPQLIRPLYDIARNKDGFTDRPIESMGAERLSPENRTNVGTSGAGVALGKLNAMFANFVSTVTGEAVNADSMKMSPIQYDYLLRGYLGWVGTVIQTTSTVAADTFKPGEAPDRKIDDMFVVGNFVKSMPANQSRYVTSFYENSKEIATATADYKAFLAAGNVDKALEVIDDKRDKIALNKLYSSMSDKMSTVQKQIDRVKADESMSGAEKRLEMDRLAQLRIEMARAVEEVRISQKR